MIYCCVNHGLCNFPLVMYCFRHMKSCIEDAKAHPYKSICKSSILESCCDLPIHYSNSRIQTLEKNVFHIIISIEIDSSFKSLIECHILLGVHMFYALVPIEWYFEYHFYILYFKIFISDWRIYT